MPKREATSRIKQLPYVSYLLIRSRPLLYFRKRIEWTPQGCKFLFACLDSQLQISGIQLSLHEIQIGQVPRQVLRLFDQFDSGNFSAELVALQHVPNPLRIHLEVMERLLRNLPPQHAQLWARALVES